MRLYILGQEIEIKDTQIAQTKQANDILSLSTRQTNYTNSFSIPRTAKNIRTLKDLGIIGNNSNIPYQKNEAYLYADSGECLVYKGWAIFSDTSDTFKCNIYDGNLEIYKAIENKTLADLDLTALAHSKTVSEVVATFDDSKPYKYILADYNGKSLYDTNKINIDYLVPSVRVSWLISQIETYTGFTFNGSFKTNPDYLNLWMTYPKGTPSDLGTTLIYNDVSGLAAGLGLTLTAGVGFTATVPIVLSYELQVPPNGTYTVTVNNNRKPISGTVTLNIGDVLGSTYSDFFSDEFVIKGELGFENIFKYNSLNIDFLDELKGMTMRDFFNEIIWRFSSTLFKEKYTKVYNLKTISEITNPANTKDWSSKFISKEGEKYIFGNYAQSNYMRYKYNDENASHNDGFLTIDNDNLEDIKTVIQSKMYSPEKSFSENLGFTTKVYKLWDKEPKDNGLTTYKGLSNRFYFVRSINKSFSPSAPIGSESLISSTTVNYAPIESFTGLSFNEIIEVYYPDIKKILNKSQIVNVKLNLKDIDVVDIDFSILYYFKQLGGSFMINKVNNFVSGKPTNVELIRINNV
jgi:hypothetical protein